MLTRIFTALSFAPNVELLDYEDDLLTVRSQKALSFASTSVKLKTSLGKIIARVLVESYDATNDVYKLRVQDRQSFPDEIVLERREKKRLARALRVTSQHFPGFTGITEDISVEGLRVNTRGPLEEGKEVPFLLELDDSRVPSLHLSATITWCAEKADGTFHAGLTFVKMPPYAQRLIEQYINGRIAIEKRLHTLEKVDPFEVM